MIITDVDHIKRAFDDWVALCNHTSNKHLIKDPYSVWLEAFTVGGILMRQRCKQSLESALVVATNEEHDDVVRLSVTDVKNIQNQMIDKARSAIDRA